MEKMHLSLGKLPVKDRLLPLPTIVIDMPTSIWDGVYKRLVEFHKGSDVRIFNTTLLQSKLNGGVRVALGSRQLQRAETADTAKIRRRTHLFAATLLSACDIANTGSKSLVDPRINVPLAPSQNDMHKDRERLQGIAMRWPQPPGQRRYGEYTQIATYAMVNMARLLHIPTEIKTHDASQPETDLTVIREPLIAAKFKTSQSVLWTDQSRSVGFRAEGYRPTQPGVGLAKQNLEVVGADWEAHLLIATAGALAVAQGGGEGPLITD
jgi:hypothetical protein